MTPNRINNIDNIFLKSIVSFRKKYPIKIEKKMLVSLNAATKGIDAFVKPQTTII